MSAAYLLELDGSRQPGRPSTNNTHIVLHHLSGLKLGVCTARERALRGNQLAQLPYSWLLNTGTTGKSPFTEFGQPHVGSVLWLSLTFAQLCGGVFGEISTNSLRSQLRYCRIAAT